MPGMAGSSARRASLVALLAGLLSACAVGPDFVKPEPEMPPAYRSELTPSEAASFADEPWFDVFNDLTLRGLIDEALASNYDLRTAAARVEQAQHQVGVTRSELEAHAKAHGLAWIEDESNASLAFDRNFLRLQVAPLLEGRFPGWKHALGRFARHAGTSAGLLERAARDDGIDPGSPLEVELLRAQSPEARAHALRTYLEDQGLPMPSEARLSEMARQLTEAREDARVRIEHGGAALVRHRDTVHVDRGPREDPAWIVPWTGEDEVVLGADRGAIRFAAVTGSGIAERYTHDGTWHFGPRGGGERIRLEAERPTRTLKNLLQETGVPEWERGRLPLLFHGEALVWVPGVGVAAGYRCGPEEPGRVPQWFPGGQA